MKKASKLSWRASLGQRFLLSLILVMVLPLLVIMLVFQNSVSREQYEQACTVKLEILKQSRESLESFSNDIEFVSKNILGDSQVQEYLKIYGSSQSAELSRINVSYAIQPIMQHRPNISAISIFDDDGIYCQFGVLVNTENQEHLEQIKALKGKGLWIPAYRYADPMLEKNADTWVVSFMRAINDLYAMQRLAIERISVDEDNICQMYSGLCMENETVFVIDHDGAIVSSTDKTMLGTVVDREPYIQLAAGRQEGWLSQEDTVAFFYQLEHPDWTVVQLVPQEQVTAGYGSSSWAFYLCLLLTGIFALCFYRIQNRTIIQPVRTLAAQTERFCGGTDEIQMCTTGSDEIAVLNRAFVDMSISIRRLIEQEYKSKLYQKEIELAYMQSQINPHFLYNTLESIRWMAVIHQQTEIADQIEALSKLFRRVLNEGSSTTTVARELEHVDVYMTLMRNRFGEKLQYEKQVDPTLLGCQVLHLVLQPLVENAIIHGIEKKRSNGYVHIVVSRAGERIRYLVEDNGAGANEDQVRRQMYSEDATKRAFALKNIDSRLKYRYGEEFGLCFSSEEGRGTVVTVEMPLVLPEQKETNETVKKL